ncbi:hypothetical protein [Neptuniibacter sp. CAU 1671]|uniref:hypothetical protein n=1 Tax=Neptuniibacter sp. CAU 1671 TaxID=3032593 RepID=UPI0023DAA65A|nr:hypothetical protein [Neptuniibacter sp. CAU 1671]MDF2181145.1 hypothetical protein [Neptuniibacter sp. CAU 1671]
MLRTLLITLIVIIAAAAFMFFNTMPQPDDVAQQMEQPATATPDTEAKTHISNLTSGADQPIDIKQANNFVTADQLIQLPAAKVQGAAEIESATSSGSDATFAVPSSRLNLSDSDAERIRQQTDPMSAGQVRLRELLDDPEGSGKIYYIHAVNDDDKEGIWGIMQNALMRTFTQGLALPGQNNTVYADIPKDADERLEDSSSSFLGRLLQGKVDRTYIYNYEKGILGDNPNLIQPGQQLLIITFSEDELVSIYRHFAKQ